MSQATDQQVIQLILKFQLPLLIVARANLGTINHTILTVAYARQYGIEPVGIILNSNKPIVDDPSFDSFTSFSICFYNTMSDLATKKITYEKMTRSFEILILERCKVCIIIQTFRFRKGL